MTAEKSSQQYEYDALDNVVKTTDGKGNETNYITDAWGRVAETVKADGSREKFTYDYGGNVTSTTDGNGNTIQYQYNSLNKLGKIIDQQGMEEIMLYDIAGNLAYKKDRNGNELRYQYDTDDNLIHVTNAGKNAKGRNRFLQPDLSESYEYYADGTLKKAMSKGVMYTYEYDKQGRQIAKWQNGKMVLQYGYDKNGNIISQKDISGKETTYTFDDIGRIQTVTDDGEKAAQYYYNSDNTLQKISYGNGITTEYGYDKDQSVISIMTAKKDGTLITQNSYTYDENGNQIQKTEKGVKTTYDYDCLNQIKKVIYDEKITEQFDYDAAGNRIKRTLEGREEKYYYNNKNQLLQIENKNDTILYKYDNQGNTLEQKSNRGVISYTYDIYNRTRQITTENGDVIKNKYDPLGLRYQKEVNGDTSRYIFDGWSIVAETDKEGELKSREVRGYELLKKETNNKQYYYHQNEHGDIIYLSNVDEEIENNYSYDVFGNVREQQENVKNIFKYAGEQFDKETQQYYLRARFYNPVVGRFTQEDVYRGNGLNLYVYVINNPLLWVDPSGFLKDRLPSPTNAYILGNDDDTTIQKAIQGDKTVLVDRENTSEFFAVLKDTPNNREAIEVLENNGLKGVWYRNKKPDFGPVALFQVDIDNMGPYRNNTIKNGVHITGNYDQTRQKLEELIYKDENTIRPINKLEKAHIFPENQTSYARRQAEQYLENLADVPRSKFDTYFRKTVIKGQNYTIHEVEIPTAQVVPYHINKQYAHNGGVAEAKENQNQTSCKK